MKRRKEFKRVFIVCNTSRGFKHITVQLCGLEQDSGRVVLQEQQRQVKVI